MMRLFEGCPDRPRPLVYPVVGTALGALTPMAGPLLMDDRPQVLPLVGLGAVGGLAIGSAFAALEAIVPTRSIVTGLMRGSFTVTCAAMGGAGVGALLAIRIGCAVVPVEAAAEAGVLGTSAIGMGGLLVGLAAVLIGLPADDF